MNKIFQKDAGAMNSQNGQKEKKITQWLITIFIVTVVALSLFGDKGFFQLMSLKERERKLSEEIEELKLEKKVWLDKIYSLKHNTSYIESIAREELGMIDQNEILIEIHYPDDPF